jgi:hypothetical protein
LYHDVLRVVEKWFARVGLVGEGTAAKYMYL